MENVFRYRQERDSSRLTRLGYGSLLVLLALSIVFYRERALFADIAYQSFLLINGGGFQIQVYRFGAAVVQVLPLLALHTGAPLWVILMAYSASFPLLYLLFYGLMVRVLGNLYLGWTLVFLFTLNVYDGFYWPSSEQQQGLAFLLLFFAFVLRYPALSKRRQWLMAGAGIVALVFYHPLLFIPFFFLWGYFVLTRIDLRHGRYVGLAVFFILTLVLKTALARNWYDDGKIGTFSTNLIQDFPNYFRYPSHRKFLWNSLRYWYFFPIALFFLTVFYVYRKKWIPLAWVWVFCLGHLLLLHIGSPHATYRFYAEVNYLPLTIYVIVPLLSEWVAPTRSRPFVFYLFLLIVTSRLVTIAFHHRPFTARLDWMEKKIDAGPPGNNRFFLPRTRTPSDTLLIDWGVAYESLLLSSLAHPDSAKTLLVLPEAGQYPDLFQSDTTFFSGLRKHNLQELNTRYFRLGKNKYQEIGR